MWFFDYTIESLADALARAVQQHGRKLDVLFDVVGLQDPTLFTLSTKYLIPSGMFVSAGSAPAFSISGIATMLRLVWEAQFKLQWLGGTPWRYNFGVLSLNRERVETVGKMLMTGQWLVLHVPFVNLMQHWQARSDQLSTQSSSLTMSYRLTRGKCRSERLENYYLNRPRCLITHSPFRCILW